MADLRRELAETRAQLTAAQTQLTAAHAEIGELRARLGQNSQNSSRPPSSDPPGTPPAARRSHRKKRKRGGQKGHTAHFSTRPDHVDQTHSYRPKTCRHCAADLADGELTGSRETPIVYELPPLQPVVHEHLCLEVRCDRCGKLTQAALPPEVPRGEYGPTVQAMTALLRGEMRQSMRQTSAVMSGVLHVPMSAAMVAKTQERVSRALAAPVAEAHAHVQAQPRVHADETGWRQERKRAWLWVAVADLVTVFLVRTSRSAAVAKELLGACFGGLLVTDRWGSYNWVPEDRRQVCWSHLRRDFKAFLAYGKEEKRVGENLLHQRKRLYRLWNRVRDGTLAWAEFQRLAQPIRARLLALLEEGRGLPSRKVSGTCKQLLKHQASLFTFVENPSVAPSNNVAERALRFPVLWRKGCFGSDSVGGSRFVERFLTVRATLRSQGRDLYTYLQQACIAALTGAPAPSILPTKAAESSSIAVAA